MSLNKASIAVALAAFLAVGGIAGQALAAPHDGHDGHWRQQRSYQDCIYQALTQEKKAQYDAIMKEFADKTAPLRDKLAAKYIELRTLGNSPTPDPKAIGKATEELVALRNEFAKERQALNERISKEVGIAMDRRGDYRPGCPGYGDCGYDRGYGSHMRRGYHMNGGYGHMNGGYHHYGMMYDARTDQTPDNN